MKHFSADSTINGKTKVWGLIGNPVGHSLSPVIHNSIARFLDENLSYLTFKVESEGLDKAIEGAYALGIEALNVTVPYKKDVMPYLENIDEVARLIGAVNFIKRTENGYIGYNTDYLGVKSTLEAHNIEVRNKTVLILGSGGAANAAAAAIAKMGVKEILIANRTAEKAASLCEMILRGFDTRATYIAFNKINSGFKHEDAIDLVINTTTLGFGDNIEKTPVENPDFFKDNEVKTVFDVIYAPWETRLLKIADCCGLKAINGFEMLFYQAIGAWEIYFKKSFSDQTKKACLKGLEGFIKQNH